jgi:hypothetical protein
MLVLVVLPLAVLSELYLAGEDLSLRDYSLESIETLFGRGLSIRYVHRIQFVITCAYPWRILWRACLPLNGDGCKRRRAHNLMVTPERINA